MKINSTVKKITKVTTAFALSLVLTSCGGFLGTDITDQKGIEDNIVPELKKVIPEDALVKKIHFTQEGINTFSKEIGGVDIVYFEKGAEKPTGKYFSFQGKVEVKDQKVMPSVKITFGPNKNDDKPEPKGIPLKDVDFSKIASNIEKGVKIVTEDGSEFTGFAGYDIILNEDPTKIIQEFTIRSQQNSRLTTTKSGRAAMEYEYLDYVFTVDPDGNVKPK